MMRWLKWARLTGILLLGWILFTIDWTRVMPTIASLRLTYLLLYLVCFGSMALVRVARLQLCVGRLGVRLRPTEAYEATVEPIFMGAVTPGRLGEFSRIAYLNRYGMPFASSLTFALMERVVDLGTMLCFAAGGIVYLFSPSRLKPLAFALIACLLMIFYFAVRMSGRMAPYLDRVASRFIRAARLPFGTEERQKAFLEWEHAIGVGATLVHALAIACVALNLCQIYALVRAFGFPVNPLAICFAYTVSSVISLLPISPAGLGTRETTYIYIMARLSIGKEQALLFSLVEGVALGTLAPVVMATPLWTRSLLARFHSARPQNQSGVSLNPLVLILHSIRKRGVRATAEHVLSEFSFDHTFRVETRIPVPVGDLAVSADRKVHSTPYQGTNWFLLKRLFGALIRAGRIDPSTAFLIDFGSGKGRVMLAALHFGIARVVGVEYDPNLCAIARRNLLKYTNRQRNGRSLLWDLVQGDVMDFTIPEEANVLFLYNPFSGPVLEAVAEQIRTVSQRSPRERIIIYVNPLHDDVFRRFGFTRTSESDGEVAIYTAAPQPLPSSGHEHSHLRY